MKHNLSILILLLPVLACSQEQLGLRLENYAGVSGISLNPASNLTNPLSWDINLAGAGFFFQNNYAYLSGTNSLDLLRNANDLEITLVQDAASNQRSHVYRLDYYDDNRKRYFNANAFLAGPSFVMKINENHSAGLFTNLRTAMSSLDFPNEFSYYRYDARPQFDPFKVEPFSGAFMSWSEIGLNYAFRKPVRSGYMGFGFNLKWLTGYEAAYLISHESWTHTKLPDNHVRVENSNGEYGLTTGNLKNEGHQAAPNGNGLGIDLGFVYIIQEYEDSYKWRLGMSLLDIGWIKFDKNAQKHSVSNPGIFELNLRDFEDFELPSAWEAFLQHYSAEALADSLASLTNNSFTMALPTALSLQADYSIDENIFFNALFIHRFPTGLPRPARESLLALTPRFEHPWFSISLPVSLINWQKVQMGAAVRLGWLVLGSDKLGSLFSRSEYSGTDLYVAIKLNRLGFSGGFFNRDPGNGNARSGSGKKVRCYDF